MGGIALLRPHLPAVHLRDRRRDRVLTHAAGRAGEQIHRALARVAPVAAPVRAGGRLWRRERKLVGHPAPRRAQPHRALLFVHVASVPQPSSAGIDRRDRGDPRGLLGADDLRASVRDRGGLLREGREPRQLDRRAILARAEMERRLGSRRSAQHAARDRHLSARRVRRPVTEGANPAAAPKDLVADRCRPR